ncbi:MAG: hypothetical protein QXU45_02440 [Candidatus Bathyarchaeia archaeon]
MRHGGYAKRRLQTGFLSRGITIPRPHRKEDILVENIVACMFSGEALIWTK